MKLLHPLLTASAVFLFAGCAGNVERSSEDQPPAPTTYQRIQAAVSDARQSAPVPEIPANVANALLAPVEVVDTATEQAPELRFDLSVDRVKAEPFFMGLVKDSPYNMIVHPSVTGLISLDLKNVTVAEVMAMVREVYGYEYERRAGGYVVLPARLQSRIFNVSYVNLSRGGESSTRVNAGQISDLEPSGENGNKSVRTVGSQITTQTSADFWRHLKDTIATIVGESEGRSVVVSPQAGLVVVRAMPGELRDVQKFLAAAQISLHKQVILEAKVVEVQLGDAFQSGINWAALGSDSTGGLAIGQLSIADGATRALGDDLNFSNEALTHPGATDTFGFGGMFALGAASDEFAALLSLLSTQGDAQVLSSPRVATINNQKAVIKVGTDEFFVTEVESTTTTGTATTTTPSITLTPFFSGIALDVTPHVTMNDEVILHIHPTVSEVEDQTKNITVGGQTQSLPLAFSSVRESDSIVKARNGQVVVIGGLMQDRRRTEKGKTPVLGDLPLLGSLFQQDRDVSSRSELVILLRPIVVDTDQVWADSLDDISDRIDALRPRTTQ